MIHRICFQGLASVALLSALAGCVHVKSDPIRVEPIYIEITINHRVQEELDDIFSEIDQASTTTEYAPLETLEDSAQ
ncbi:MAG: hypothetical protein ACLFR7_04650 [Opitutales bacterium]